MSTRERILKALKGERASPIPWIPLCYRDFFLSLPEYRKRFEGEGWEDDERELAFRLNFYRSIGADYG